MNKPFANEFVSVTTDSFDLPVLCGECPAIAEVLHVERSEEMDSLMAVVRCHGEVFFLDVTGRLIRKRTKLLLEDLLPARVTADEMLKVIDEREARAERALRAAAFYRDAIVKSGVPLDGSQDKRERYTVLAELLMNHAELYK